MAVLRHSGPCMIAPTTLPIQLSPLSMESPLCCDWGPAGMTSERPGRWPALASVITRESPTRLLDWDVYKQSANVGQMSQPYERVRPAEVA